MTLVNRDFYFYSLYPLQDHVLHVLSELDIGFYLSGGTAASRGYLHHRFSDDLDLFVNDDNNFNLWSQRVIQGLSERPEFSVQVLVAEQRFVRLNVVQDQILLKVEMINDVPARVGSIQQHPILGRLDSAENILANKVTAALDREEPKDLADIWGFCSQLGLSLTEAIENAHSKAAGIFPADLARVLISTTNTDWALVRWISAPLPEEFVADLQALGEKLIVP